MTDDILFVLLVEFFVAPESSLVLCFCFCFEHALFEHAAGQRYARLPLLVALYVRDARSVTQVAHVQRLRQEPQVFGPVVVGVPVYVVDDGVVAWAGVKDPRVRDGLVEGLEGSQVVILHIAVLAFEHVLDEVRHVRVPNLCTAAAHVELRQKRR